MERNNWLNALNKLFSGLLLVNAAFPFFVLVASMSWATVVKYLLKVSAISWLQLDITIYLNCRSGITWSIPLSIIIDDVPSSFCLVSWINQKFVLVEFFSKINKVS
jgi:hypothetical protein